MPKSAKASTGERKRSFVDDGSDDQHESEMQSRKTTLHLENQERAYVAASRRTDRSLEARYQSALMASEVHKKRTGRSLRITYKIVEDEEMYEEEDQGFPESWQLSHNSHRSRTLSLTDAYIAALIARKSGMQNYFEHSNAFFASPFLNNAAWAGLPPATPSHNNPAQTAQQPTEYSESTDNLASLSEFEFDTESKFAPRPRPDAGMLAEAAPFAGEFQHAHKSSSDSSISDLSTENSNYMFEHGSDTYNSSPETLNLRLEDCLVDTEGEGSWNFPQNGIYIG